MTSVPGTPRSDGDAFCFGVGDLLGFCGDVSPAKLAIVHSLTEESQNGDWTARSDHVQRVLEIRVHGLGGSVPRTYP
jgi:hypothetical protein